MKNLVSINNNIAVTSSRKVAEVFEKEHNNVLRDIRNLLNDSDNSILISENFKESSYTNARGRSYPEFLMTRDGFTLLAMGFTGTKALEWKLKYIEAFNQMENQINLMASDSYLIENPIERARAWIREQEEREQLNKIVQIQAPKVEYFDRVLEASGSKTTTQVAKLLGLKSAIQLNNMLHEVGIQYKQSGQWLLYSKYSDKGYTETATHMYTGSDGYEYAAKSTKWTEKGIHFIYEKLKSNGLLKE